MPGDCAKIEVIAKICGHKRVVSLRMVSRTLYCKACKKKRFLEYLKRHEKTN